jgi:hypothetical protein
MASVENSKRHMKADVEEGSNFQGQILPAPALNSKIRQELHSSRFSTLEITDI